MAMGSKRRVKVIKAMIAFIVILALLTFFSNTIMNLTIPKVMGSYASRGNLSYSNNARGTITVDNQTEVKGLEGRTVEKVLVGNYDLVKKGDQLFTLKPIEESSDLQSKKDSLVELQRAAEYDSRTDDSVDFSSYYDTINSCKESLSQAEDTLDKVRNRDDVEAENKAIIDEESVKAVSLEASVTAAAKTVEDLKKDISAIDSQIAPLESQIQVYVALGTPTPTPTPAPGTSTPEAVPEGASPTPIPDLDPDGIDRNSPTYEIDKLMFKIGQLEEQKKAISSQLSDAQARLDEASAALAECQGKIAEAKAEIAELATLPTETAAQNAVTAAQHAVTAAQKSLNDAQTQAGITQDKNRDLAEDREKQIAKLEKEIAELEKAAKITAITAPADGYVYNVSVYAGDSLTAKDIVAYIIPEFDRVCSVTFEFTSQAAQSIYIGQALDVTSGFIDGCTVASIKPDPKNPRGTRLVKCIVDGNDAWPGEEITVNAGKGNDNYKCVVPASAVNEDNSGNFVYVIQGSSTPLGDKYTVKRVDVTVEAEDGAAKAIKGEGLDKYDVMIVIRSEKPLEDGQRVRLEDYTAK
jgi:multidrug resistance efflux pump